MSFTIFQNEKMLFQAIKTRSSKSRNIDIFRKGLTHGFGLKMALFLTFFFIKYRPGKCLLRYSRTKKNPFQAIKTRSSKSRKIDIFAWFWSKDGPFSNLYCLCNIGQENVFYDILERKNPFLGYKNKKFKKSKNSHFCKGVNQQFWSKICHFSNFFFLGNIGQGNVFYDILEQKTAF